MLTVEEREREMRGYSVSEWVKNVELIAIKFKQIRSTAAKNQRRAEFIKLLEKGYNESSIIDAVTHDALMGFISAYDKFEQQNPKHHNFLSNIAFAFDEKSKDYISERPDWVEGSAFYYWSDNDLELLKSFVKEPSFRALADRTKFN